MRLSVIGTQFAVHSTRPLRSLLLLSVNARKKKRKEKEQAHAVVARDGRSERTFFAVHSPFRAELSNYITLHWSRT